MIENKFNFPAIKVAKKTGEEFFTSSEKALKIQVTDFWKWSVSDLVSNATRGILAEFLVASALELSGGVRNEWDAFDILMRDGTKIEVKSAAYLQSWAHANLSKITFKISPTYGWDSQTNKTSAEQYRQADIYIFCLLKHLNKETLDPLNLDQWEFYLLTSKILNEQIPTQKSISLAKLLKLEPLIAKYENLSDCVAKLKKQI